MDIRKEFTIGAPRDAVWAALTDPEVIVSWGGGPAVMAPVPGFAFSLWDGDIHGTVTASDPGRSMTQEWYSGDWSSSSIVTFTLSEDPNGMTHVELVQTGVPDGEAAEIDAGWDEYYFDPLTRLLEEGAAWA